MASKEARLTREARKEEGDERRRGDFRNKATNTGVRRG